MAEQTSRTIRLGVEGMGCGGCAASLETLLQQAQGVLGASVSFTQREAQIEYDPERITPGDLAALLREAGYGVLEPAAVGGA